MNFQREYLKELLDKNEYTYPILKKEIEIRGYKISIPTIKSWFQSGSTVIPEFKNLIALGEIFKIDPISLISENPFMLTNSDIIMVDKLDIRAGAGSAGILDVPKENNKVAIDIKLLDKGLDPKYLKIIEVIGDSMQPDYEEGDFALIDMVAGRGNFVKIAGTYIVRVDDVIYIKDVEFLPHNKIKLISTNKKYGDMYPHQEGYECEILGKVCGKFKFEKGLTFNYQGIK